MNRFFLILLAVLAVAVGACKSTPSGEQRAESSSAKESPDESAKERERAEEGEKIEALPATSEEPALEVATFAGGCFWCVEPPFDETEGVERTIVGYTGGQEEHPTYEQVSSGQTSHAEAIRVYFDPDEVSYDELLDVFWRNVDPTQENGQFVDVGSQYRTAVYYHDDEQKKLAKSSKEELAESGPFDEPIVTEIVAAETFWKAEEYHQNFYQKSPLRYKSYRSGSGRDEFIERVWGDE